MAPRTVWLVFFSGLAVLSIAVNIVVNWKVLQRTATTASFDFLLDHQSPTNSSSIRSHSANASGTPDTPTERSHRKFYIIQLPELTTWLTGNYTNEAHQFYEQSLNEQQAEIWLHRGMARMSYQEGQTLNPNEADVFLIPAYLHLKWHLSKTIGQASHNKRKRKNQKVESPSLPYADAKDWIQLVLDRIPEKMKIKPHVLMVPTWNPQVSRKIGLNLLTSALQERHVNLFSLGFERNTYWQHVEPDRIVIVPYVVAVTLTSKGITNSSDTTQQQLLGSPAKEQRRLNPNLQIENDDNHHGPVLDQLVDQVRQSHRVENFVFYAGSSRKHASEWSGCNRSMILPLSRRTDMDVRLIDGDSRKDSKEGASNETDKGRRLSQQAYNDRMLTAEYCLSLCGDTPTSRSLSSAMAYGCIPIRIGSRLRGFCEPPSCHPGWGWTANLQPTQNEVYRHHRRRPIREGAREAAAASVQPLSHLPFPERIDWNAFPEISEEEFAKAPAKALHDLFATIIANATPPLSRPSSEGKYISPRKWNKQAWHRIVRETQLGFVYGAGNPVTSNEFGEACSFTWTSLVEHLSRRRQL